MPPLLPLEKSLPIYTDLIEYVGVCACAFVCVCVRVRVCVCLCVCVCVFCMVMACNTTLSVTGLFNIL